LVRSTVPLTGSFILNGGYKNIVLSKSIRQIIKYILTGSKGLALQRRALAIDKMEAEQLGVYLHIPFCRVPCLYCPYFKEKFDKNKALAYKDAVIKEIEFYRPLLKGKKITSFYIGGGTPTTMIGYGLEEIISTIQDSFDLRCDISAETHPNDITPSAVKHLKDIGVKNVSMGIESFNDRFLKKIGRPYTSNTAKKSIKVLRTGDFKCINIDIMFGLPDQKIADVEEDIKTAISLDVDQISAYPIFTFPHTKLKQIVKESGSRLPGIIERRRMLRVIERLCYDAEMDRTSVWAFTKRGVDKYSSVTIPHYIGLGAGAGSLIPGSFFINIFNVLEYVKYLREEQKPPIALSIDFSEKEEMIHWLYWKIYETKIDKKEFKEQFGKDFDKIFGKLFVFFKLLGLSHNYKDRIIMTDKGNYWVHVLQNLFSLDFIGRVWSVCLVETWPKEIELI
jgi:oxygen-independent coproporphyrinogen-3 oxidase